MENNVEANTVTETELDLIVRASLGDKQAMLEFIAVYKNVKRRAIEVDGLHHSAQEVINSQKVEIDILKKDNAEIRSQIGIAAKEASEMEQAQATRIEQLRRLERKNDELVNANGNYVDEYNGAKELLDETQKERDNLGRVVSSLEEVIAKRENELDNNREDISNLKIQLDNALEENAVLMEKLKHV